MAKISLLNLLAVASLSFVMAAPSAKGVPLVSTAAVADKPGYLTLEDAISGKLEVLGNVTEVQVKHGFEDRQDAFGQLFDGFGFSGANSFWRPAIDGRPHDINDFAGGFTDWTFDGGFQCFGFFWEIKRNEQISQFGPEMNNAVSCHICTFA
ncbi:hypothetical protein TARUN_7058 [Trichoderma arundinaceum]|uniref:Uncharacterized protein n=1 Tax=Trichoderma arundinaceum TaxID=490622 RepID=A0A395NGV7_TRIAR|nr:hypothetical protein TARUN_7058 [Trichoderma arundinaceum]